MPVLLPCHWMKTNHCEREFNTTHTSLSFRNSSLWPLLWWIEIDTSLYFAVSAGALTVGLVRQCQTIHGRDRTCIPPRLPPEWVTTLFFIIMGIISLTVTCGLLVASHWRREATKYARWIAFTGSKWLRGWHWHWGKEFCFIRLSTHFPCSCLIFLFVWLRLACRNLWKITFAALLYSATLSVG